MKSQILTFGVGAAFEAETRRQFRFRLMQLCTNAFAAAGLSVVALAVATRPLPVVELHPEEGTGACRATSSHVPEAVSATQVESWVRELAQLLLVQDSLRVDQNLSRGLARLSPNLRLRLQGSRAMLAHFAEIKTRNLAGRLERFHLDCGAVSFVRATTPWHCLFWGTAIYGPAVGPLPKDTKPLEGVFFAKVSIGLAPPTLDNPLGLEAVAFHPQEAATEDELKQILLEATTP